MGFRWWAVEGAGKLFFLSMAWTARSKRWKIDSARVRIGMSSMVLESSLTWGWMLVNVDAVSGWSVLLTVFQDFVKVFQMIHDYIAVLLENCHGNE